jgi:hypothetical protein
VPPRAYGISPVAVVPSGSVVAAVARGEAVWLGLQALNRSRPATVRVRVDGREPIDAVTGEPWEEALVDEPRNYLVTPPDSRLQGRLFRSGDRLTIRSEGATPASVAVEFVPPQVFRERTGIVPDPLDPDAAYKGWRLP